MNQIRLNKTPQIEKVLTFLKNKYRLLSEAEIIKVALSEKYLKEAEAIEKEERVKKAWERLKVAGKKIGDRMLAEKGLKREDVTEQQFYDLFFDDHKHKA